MKEKTIVKKISDYLYTLPNCWHFKVHGGGYQNPGIPDIIGCLNGRLFGIEVKNETGKTTVLQDLIIARIKQSKGRAGVARTIEDVNKILHIEKPLP